MFRWRDKGQLSGHKLEGLQRRVRAALERKGRQRWHELQIHAVAQAGLMDAKATSHKVFAAQ